MNDQIMADGTADQKAATTTASKPSTKQRLNLDLAPAAYEQLQQLSKDTGKTMAEVLRTGLALYSIARDAKKDGQSLSVTEDGKVIKEIVLT
jgi:predicted DNA-binding protein